MSHFSFLILLFRYADDFFPRRVPGDLDYRTTVPIIIMLAVLILGFWWMIQEFRKHN
ncbi:hypothetical protein [Pontibacter sp. G13]|uniref:hypothetical protein n=1 Tax=Pontibacter sp. G13 TaxID=3074898 RepID=UPI0028890258|nr:hypothetical protein [Pontibacter sp. G13]WNJ16741.1 hypothetical protein RJD25_17885 [Pontibacter sp. G13]